MNIFENFNKAKQKFGENLARQAIEAKIPNQFVYAACKFNAENGTPFNDLYLLFSQWTTYVVSKNANINVDALDYNTFWSTIQDYKKQYGEEGKVYDDGTVSITHISSLEQMKKLPIKNLWCIRREKHWNEYQEKGARFYLITNNNYSDESNCRYVMVEMYANGEIGYWSTDNELIDAEGSTKRLPPLAEYQKTLGGALQKIKELQRKITESKQYTNINKKLIRLTESDLHRIVKESLNRVLNESKYEEGYDSGQFLCQTQVEMYGEEAAKEKIRKELEIREYWAEENRKNRRTQDPFKKGEADALADWLMSSMGAEGTTFKR